MSDIIECPNHKGLPYYVHASGPLKGQCVDCHPAGEKQSPVLRPSDPSHDEVEADIVSTGQGPAELGLRSGEDQQKPEAVAMAIRLARFEAFGEAIAICEAVGRMRIGKMDAVANVAASIAQDIEDLRCAAKPRELRSEAAQATVDQIMAENMPAATTKRKLEPRTAEARPTMAGRVRGDNARSRSPSAQCCGGAWQHTDDCREPLAIGALDHAPRRERAKP